MEFLFELLPPFRQIHLYTFCNFVEPYGQRPWHLTNAQAGRHPGQKLAHSSTAKGRTFLLPG
jgi:hypothetical protein